MSTTPATSGQNMILAAASIFLLTVWPLGASDTDDRIGAFPKKYYVVEPRPSNDASITAQIKRELVSHCSITGTKTKVETTKGVVTLTGVAKSATERALVTKLASEIKGVSSVTNNMTIQAAASNAHSAPLPPQNLRIVGVSKSNQ